MKADGVSISILETVSYAVFFTKVFVNELLGCCALWQ